MFSVRVLSAKDDHSTKMRPFPAAEHRPCNSHLCGVQSHFERWSVYVDCELRRVVAARVSRIDLKLTDGMCR